MAEDIIDKILRVLFWIFVIITVVLVLWKVFGSSPLIDQIIAALAPAMFVEFVRIERTLARHEIQIENINKNLEEIKGLVRK